LERFVLRVTNSKKNADHQELDNIVKYLRLNPNETDIHLKQVKIF
jgi:hypothetical protein